MDHVFFAVLGIHIGSWLCAIYMAIKFALIDFTYMMTPDKARYMRQFLVTSLLVGVISGIAVLIFWGDRFYYV